jgi:thioredoxin reductase (NADPH)
MFSSLLVSWQRSKKLEYPEEGMKADRDLIIIGGGGAGLAAAQYAARANLSPLLLEELATGGQALIIDRLENYPGFPEAIPGTELTRLFEEQAVRFGTEIKYTGVQKLTWSDGRFTSHTDDGPLTSLAVILATGARHRTLNVPGEKEYAGKGVSYCATCDGPFFKGQPMVVVGGGDAACDESAFLAHLSDSVLMVHRRDRFRAQKALSERTLSNPHIQVRFNTELKEIRGNAKVQEVVLLDKKTGKTVEQKTSAVFVFIGSIPQTRVIEGLEVKLDEAGYVETDQRMQTSLRGLFAAGDVRATPFRQLVVAAGEGAIAAHSAAQYIDELKGDAYR